MHDFLQSRISMRNFRDIFFARQFLFKMVIKIDNSNIDYPVEVENILA